MDRRTIIIKKYENRRLYDTTNSRYVNLEEVAEMIRRGENVQVVDAATGEDLTRLVLTQIIVEEAKVPDSSFPLDVLRQMVVATGKATQETTLKYMKTVLDMYQNAYRAITPPLYPFEFGQTPPAPRAPYPGATPPFQNTPARDVDRLKQRVEELETLVSKLGASKAGVKKKARKPRRR